MLTLVKDCAECFAGMSGSSLDKGASTLTIYYLEKEANSVEQLIANSSALCLSSIEQVVGGSTRRKPDSDETSRTVIHWKYVAASLIVDGLFLLLLMSVFFACTKGDDTAEYRYALDRSRELPLAEDWTGPLSQGLVRRKSLISIVSVEDLPTSPRLLYPHKLRRSTVSLTSTLASVAVSEIDELTPLVEEEQPGETARRGTSIFSHPTMTIWWKASVPVLILVTIGFYVS